MGQKDSRPSNGSISSSSTSHTGHKAGARQNEGPLTSASLIIPQSAKMTKKKQTTVIHKCTDCEYETTVKQDFGTHRMRHDVKSAHKCPLCSFSSSSMRRLAVHVKYYHTKTDKKALATEEQSNSVAKKRAEEWHQFPSGQRVKYKFCADCKFKTTANLKLDVHIKLMHPFSATTALQSLGTLKDEKHKYNCAHCPFKTNQKTRFERHDACHGNQSTNHRCHLCSFSGNHRGHLALHLKLHCREEENNIGDRPNIEKDRDKNSTFRTSRINQRSLLSCRNCRLFKTSSRFTLKRHVKRAHPFSLSALPPLSKKRKRNNDRVKKSGLKVAQRAHQPASEETREEWYIPPSGIRKRYIYCADCDYRTVTRTKLNQHARTKHPPSKTAITAKLRRESRAVRRNRPDPNQEPSGKEDSLIESSVMIIRHINQPNQKSSQIPLQKKANNHSFKCLERDYFTGVKTNMNAHKKMHQQNGKFKCEFCSYSSNSRSSTAIHFKNGHHRNLKLLENPARIQEVPSEARLSKQSGIKECNGIQPLSAKVIIPENAELLPPDKESDQITDVPNPEKLLPSDEEGDHVEDENEGRRERNGKIQLLQSRLKSTEEEARIADEKLKQISSKKMNIQKRMDEIPRRMALIKYNLLLEHRSLLEMQLAAHDAGEEPSEILKQSVEEEVKSLEDERDVVEGELQALKEEAKSLDQNLEDARGSHFQVFQVLKSLQSELDGLLNICV